MPKELEYHNYYANGWLQIVGHSFRRTSTSLLADTGADMLAIKRHGGWKSSTVAESYIDNSLKYKRDTENRIKSSLRCPGINESSKVSPVEEKKQEVPKDDNRSVDVEVNRQELEDNSAVEMKVSVVSDVGNENYDVVDKEHENYVVQKEAARVPMRNITNMIQNKTAGRV